MCASFDATLRQFWHNPASVSAYNCAKIETSSIAYCCVYPPPSMSIACSPNISLLPRANMAAFLTEQFARGGRQLGADTLQAIFALAGDSPSDQQQFSYHLWTQSTPASIGLPELRRAFATLMVEVSRRGEVILDEATSAQRRALFAVAVREGEEYARDAFLRFAGFRQHSSLTSAMRPFLKGNNAILEKRGSKVSYRERFMRLWMLLQVMRNPSMFPAARSVQPEADYSLLLPYLADALK
jgi:hypothetical protein